MITDISQRYVLAAVNGQLWRYDARWRTYRLVDASDGQAMDVLEGSEYMAVVVRKQDNAEIIVTVRSPLEPEKALAAGTFDSGKWVFTGEKSYWETVPEYVLIPNESGTRSLLRIADNAELDPLEGLGPIIEAVHVPESRLVLLVRSGGYIIYDPVARRPLFEHELAEKNPAPTARFRTKDEMWINDLDTMVKVEAKQFEPIDAAGSDNLEASGEPGRPGRFGRWSFAAAGELCVVTRPVIGDVLVLDAISMLPVAHAVYRTGIPMDAVMVGRNTIVAVSAQGTPLRARLRRVKPSDVV